MQNRRCPVCEHEVPGGQTPLAKWLLHRHPELGNILLFKLFKSQTELARLILKVPDSGYTSEINLRSYLNQVLLGRRRCSENLGECIVRVTLGKVPKKDQGKVEERLREAIQTHNEETVPRQVEGGGRAQKLIPLRMVVYVDEDDVPALLAQVTQKRPP